MLAIQPDGKIVAAGSADGVHGSTHLGVAYSLLALARYNPNGTADTSFGTNGLGTVVIGLNGGEGNEGNTRRGRTAQRLKIGPANNAISEYWTAFRDRCRSSKVHRVCCRAFG